MLVEQFTDTRCVAEVPCQPSPPGGPALIRQRRVRGVGAVIDPRPQRVAAAQGERLLEPFPVLQGHHPPLHRLEHGVETVEEPVGDDRVEALAVVVDDPPDVGHIVLPRFEQRFEDVPLVEFRVAGERDHASRGGVVGHKFPLAQKLLGECGEARHRNAHPDRASRDVDVVAVLRARRVRLCATEATKPLQLVPRLIP